MNKNKKKGTRGCGNIPFNGCGSGGDRNRLKAEELAELHAQEAGSNGELPVVIKCTGTSGDDLMEGKQVNPSCEAQEQRDSRHVGFRNSTTSGNAWSMTTRVGGGCPNCGDSLITASEKDKGPNSVEAALGVGANGDTCSAGTCNASVDTHKDGIVKSTSTSSNGSSSTSGTDCKGKRSSRNANGEAGQSNNTTNGTKGGESCWKRADGRKKSRAYAVAAGRALGIMDEKSAAAGTEVIAAVPKGEVDSCNAALTKQAGSVVFSWKKEEKREQQNKSSITDGRRQPGVQQRVPSVLQEEDLTENKGGADAANEIGDSKSVLCNFLQWQQHSAALDSVGEVSLSGNGSSHSCWSKQLQTQKPCQLLRSQTATEGASGGHATAGRQRLLVHSKSLGSAPTQPAGGTRASEEGRVRHLTKTAALDAADESQPMRSSALALQSALVSLLQLQEKQNGGNGRTSKPVMPRRNLMCTSLLRTGVCANPERCNYAHNLLELQKKLELRKTSLCKYWLRGKCENDDCNFAHGEHELQSTDGVYKTTICKYWKQGACYSGSSCRHAHGEDDLRPERLPPHLERKRLHQLQKMPWRSSSFSPSTTSSTSAATAMFDRTQSAVDVNRATGRSEAEASTAARCLLTKSLTSGDVSQLFAPRHDQDREEPPTDLAAIAAQVLANVAAGTCSADNVLLEALKNPLRAAEKKPKPYDTVVEDTAAILSSAASVLSRVRMLHREDTNDGTTLSDSTKQMPITKSDRHTENAELLRSAALLERATSESGLQADQLLQLWDNILPRGGRVRGPPPGMENGEQRPNGRDGLRGNVGAGAAAAVVGAAGAQIQTSLLSPETSVAKKVAIQPELNALMSTVCHSLLERQLTSNERVPADDSTGLSGSSTTNSDEHDFLPALLNGVNTGTQQQWLAGDIGEVSQFQLNRRTSPLSKSTRSPCAGAGIPGLVCEEPHAAAALPSEIERFRADDASGAAGTNSTRSSCLQDILGCSDLSGRPGVIAGSGERHSLRLQELLAEQMIPTAGTQAEPDKVTTFQALSAPRIGSDRYPAYSMGILSANGECGGGGLGKESLAALPPVGLDSYRCAALLNNNIYAGAKSTPLDVASPNVTLGSGESIQRTGGGRGSADCTGTFASAFPRDRPRDPEVMNDSLGGSLGNGTQGSAFGFARTGVEGGSVALTGNDNRFSSACWRATDADATLLNQRSSSTVQLEAPLNRSPTLPSMSDYMVEGSGDGRYRTGPMENIAYPHGSYPYQQLKQRSLTGCLTGAGEKEEAKESGHSLWPSTPGFTFAELFEREAQECVALGDDAFGAVGAAGVSDSATDLDSGITCLKKRKEQRHELVARSVWGQTTFFEHNNPANTSLQPVSESARADSTVFDNDVSAELSESVAALRIVTAEEDMSLAGKGGMVMQPLKGNVDESEEDAVQCASLSKDDRYSCGGRFNCSSENGGTRRISEQTFCSLSGGAHGSCCNISSCGVTPQHDDASFSVSSWCLSTVGGVRTPSGGAPTSSVDCTSPSALSDSGGSGKIGRKLLDLSSSSSTIFPP